MYLRPESWPMVKACSSVAVGLLLGVAALAAVAGQLGNQPQGVSEAQTGKCATYSGVPKVTDGSPAGMVRISGGEFLMGSDRHHPEERPARRVSVGAFLIDRHEVTNAQFAEFVKATGYVTMVERPVDAQKYKGAQPDLLKSGSIVFRTPPNVSGMSDMTQWWLIRPERIGANPRDPAPISRSE